jgi:hypothetical protein
MQPSRQTLLALPFLIACSRGGAQTKPLAPSQPLIAGTSVAGKALPTASAGTTKSEFIEERPIEVPCWNAGDELTRPTGREQLFVPRVIGHSPLARSVDAWVRDEVPDTGGASSEGQRDLQPFACESRFERGVKTEVLNGLISLSFGVPYRIEQKFGFSPQTVFAIESGAHVAHLIAPERQDALHDKVGDRYKAVFERSLAQRAKDLGSADDCTDESLVNAYRPDYDDFDFHSGRVTFNTWNSIPMYAKVCYPTEVVEFSISELEPFLDPSATAALR